MKAYEFYSLDEVNQFHFIGIFSERRKDSERITEESVICWVRQMLGEEAGIKDIFFGTIRLKGIGK